MSEPRILTPSEWEDYELIDSGGFEKLERFGKWITIRPEPQAIWDKGLAGEEWERMADAVFRRNGDGKKNREAPGDERGEWKLSPDMPEQWQVGYSYRDMNIRMRLGLTSFKHVGLFPEQAENWKFIYNTCLRGREQSDRQLRVLNLFAYTGGATLAARSAGAEVTHLDSVKQVVGWARENMELSGLDGVRWIVDDALKFVRREVKRGNMYDGIVMDPPAYGRGPDGEKWVLEQNIGELLGLCSRILAPANSFVVLNLYSMGLSSLVARSAALHYFGAADDSRQQDQFGELYFRDRGGRCLPQGVYYRFFRRGKDAEKCAEISGGKFEMPEESKDMIF